MLNEVPAALTPKVVVGKAFNLVGPAPLKYNLGGCTAFPPAIKPPILSPINGWLNSPPSAILNLEAKMFGKEFSCALIKRAPSVKPDVKEAPTAT